MADITQTNAFGTDDPVDLNQRARSPQQAWRQHAAYRKRSPDPFRACKRCEQSRRKRFHDKTYWKCLLLGNSNGPATDIHANGTCRFFTSTKELSHE